MGVIKAALKIFAPPKAQQILDIGAGDGRWGKIAKQLCPEATLTGVDIRELSRPELFDYWYDELDFSLPLTSLKIQQTFDLVIGNPPFYCVQQVIENAWGLMANHSMMILLLRLEFMTTETRYKNLFNYLTPVTVSPIVKRVDCTGPNQPNNHAIFVWEKRFGKNPATPHEWQSKLLYHQKEIVE